MLTYDDLAYLIVYLPFVNKCCYDTNNNEYYSIISRIILLYNTIVK